MHSDQEIMKHKGPTIMNNDERAEYLKHCKFVQEIRLDAPYAPTFELLEETNTGYYAHGDDIATDIHGVDITQKFRDRNMFKLFKRTEGVSTTDITSKLLKLAETL